MKTLISIIILLMVVNRALSEPGREPFISGAVNSTFPEPFYFSLSPCMANLNNEADSSNSGAINFFALAETSPSKFGISELNSAYMAAGFFYSDNIIFRAGFGGIVNDIFSEYTAKAAGTYLFDNFALGFEAEYSNLMVTDFNSFGYLSLNIGGLISIDKSMNAGFRLKNINAGSYPGSSAPVYRELSAGMSFEPGDKLSADINAIILLDRTFGLSAALAYNYLELLQARIAYLTNPDTMEFSVWYSATENISIAYTLNYHTVLGFSNRIGSAWKM
ncbi:MAG: hypothetical protein ACLFR2_07720 [Candidatus Kapaibacterium sp.]